VQLQVAQVQPQVQPQVLVRRVAQQQAAALCLH
jgi:hypothetical protein